MNEATDENGRISFNAGLATGSVFIDNVVLSKNDKTAIASYGKFLQNESSTFSVYNTKGAFVCKLQGTRLGDVRNQLNSLNLDRGVYIVKGR